MAIVDKQGGPRVRLSSKDLVPERVPLLEVDGETYWGTVYNQRTPGLMEAEVQDAWNGGWDTWPVLAPDGTELEKGIPHSRVQRRLALEGVAMALIEGLTETMVRGFPMSDLLELLYTLDFLERPKRPPTIAPMTTETTSTPKEASASAGRRRTRPTSSPPSAPATASGSEIS